ncbi:MAG: protein kinase, partial [Myxococcota bacterium]
MESGHQQFGPFQIVRTLGRGGMGEVFVARTPWSKNPIAAVKRLRPDVARVPTFAERFQHESELAVRLEHENVVATIDVGSVEGQLYVASELVQGKDTGIIADRLRERGQGGPAAVAIRLMLDVLSGLAYVHEAVDLDGTPLALVHRDITPGNV